MVGSVHLFYNLTQESYNKRQQSLPLVAGTAKTLRSFVCSCRLRRNFIANKPNEKRVSEITNIKVERGHVYLAVIMVLFPFKLIGRSLDATMTNQLITDALNMPVASHNVEPGLIVHPDR